MAEERQLHEQKLAKMEVEMKTVFQQKVMEKEAKLRQSEEELYARHREMRDALEKQKLELEDKKRRLESGRPLTPTDRQGVSDLSFCSSSSPNVSADEEEVPPDIVARIAVIVAIWTCLSFVFHLFIIPYAFHAILCLCFARICFTHTLSLSRFLLVVTRSLEWHTCVSTSTHHNFSCRLSS